MLKVFSAWVRFAQGQQQYKERIEKAKGVYHAALLREGVTRILRYTAGMKQLRGELQAWNQMKVRDKSDLLDTPRALICSDLWSV